MFDMATKGMAGDETMRGFFEGLFEALADKHSQLDINLQGMTVGLPNSGLSLRADGLITLTVHVRELTEEEKRASAEKNVVVMSK
jgi:hypothetical protein